LENRLREIENTRELISLIVSFTDQF
jgi:hypothetical protein